jgi:hypothetical protein
MEIRVFEETVMSRTPNSAAARHMHRLFAEGTISGAPDGQLLEQFLDRRDESAFTALVERHGPMVFGTCQAVVRDRGAAEDAFQATFLVLVCKARTIRGREAIGGWLHRVAYRSARQASADAALRRGRVVTQDLFVETGGSLTVSVVGPDGKPLAGTWVAGLQDMRRWEKPKSDVSTYSIGGLTPGKGRVLSFLNEGNRLTGELVLRGDETAPQSVALHPSCTLTGRIINGDREPWGECQLDGVDLPGAYPPVDNNGRFRIEGLLPNKPHSLRILAAGSRLQGFVARDLTLNPGEVRDLGDVVPEDADK